MSETQTAVVAETPAPTPLGDLESVSAFRDARDKGLTEIPAAVVPADPVTPEPPVAEPDPASEAGKELAKKKTSLQARIDQAVKAQRDAERKAADLEARLAARDAQPPTPAEPAKPTEPTTPAVDPAKPRLKAFTEQIGTKFDSYEDAVEAHAEALSDYKDTQRAQMASQAALARAQQDRFAAHQGRVAAFTAEHADFEALVSASSVQVSQPMAEAMLASDHGPAMQYHFATHPDDAARIAGLPPGLQLFEMGKLEARVAKVDAPSGPSAAVVPETNAPQPIKPVGSRSTGASTASPDDITSVADWRKRRADFVN